MSLRSMVGACAVSLCVITSSAHAAVLLTEGFDDVTTLAGAGWVQTNNSNPLGESDWFQGNTGIFVSETGADDSYIAANFLNAGVGGNVSNWLILPTMALDPTISLSFFTRAAGGSPFPDRLEVRLSTSGASSDVGATDASVGDFSILLFSINEALDVGGYPTDWTQFTTSLDSVLGGPASGRLAFRYFVDDTSTNGDYIGIDTVEVVSVPEPSSMALFAFGLAIFFYRQIENRFGSK